MEKERNEAQQKVREGTAAVDALEKIVSMIEGDPRNTKTLAAQ